MVADREDKQNDKQQDKQQNEIIPIGRFEGSWSEELSRFEFVRLINATDTDAQSSSTAYRQRTQELAYGGYYHASNTRYYQQFGEDLPAFATRMAKATGLESFTVSMIRQDPGNSIPWHRDHYFQMKRKLGRADDDSDGILRFLVFLEDWKVGHYFQAGQTPFVQWKSGDVITFPPDMYHLSSNCGLEPKYTLQVTGLVGPDSIFHRASASARFQLAE